MNLYHISNIGDHIRDFKSFFLNSGNNSKLSDSIKILFFEILYLFVKKLILFNDFL